MVREILCQRPIVYMINMNQGLSRSSEVMGHNKRKFEYRGLERGESNNGS